MSEERQLINRFLADNPELEELSAKLSEFNIFRVLKIEDHEIRHSNTLAWLLDPEESHGFGDHVLKRLLSNILLTAANPPENISAADIELQNLSDIEVRREWMHLDIAVIDRGNHFVLLLENKVYAKESRGQLRRYRQAVEKEFPGYKVIPVFLTLDGCEAEEEEFVAYGYPQLLGVIERIYYFRKTQLSASVSTFVEHYLTILRGLTMSDSDLVKLCQTVYRKHREAIDLILKHGMSTQFQEVAEKVLRKTGKFKILDVGSTWVWFIPNSWERYLPTDGTSWDFDNTETKYGVMCWMILTDKKIRLVFEVGGMKDSDRRIKYIKALMAAGFKLRKAALEPDATYSRFVSLTNTVQDPSDPEEIEEAVEKLLGKVDSDFERAAKAFAGCGK